MSQLDDEKLKCVQCKKLKQNIKKTYCETCISYNCEQKYGRCADCKQTNTGKNWCQACNSKRFQQNFDNWTSGNNDIDKLIQNTQLSAENYHQILEWIPYNRFGKTKYIAEGGFGKVYKASWKDGYITHWDMSCHQWKRCRDNNSFVALKSLTDSQNVTLKFINEVYLSYYLGLKVHEYRVSDHIIKCHGITQDPNTKEFIMVMYYAENGNLNNSLNIRIKKIYREHKKYDYSNLSLSLQIWKHKINNLRGISAGLKRIHAKELIHQDLHIGNIVCNNNSSRITDLGLCKPANYNGESKVFGVLPYLAPEILRGQNYTKASDIYRLGIIMYEIISEFPPYYNVAHDEILALNICEGLRPEFKIKVPKLILHIIKSCLDANPSNRPEARNLLRTFSEWLTDIKSYSDFINTELIKQIEEIEITNNNSSASNNSASNYLYKTHPEAVYKSRPLNFENLPEPKKF